MNHTAEVVQARKSRATEEGEFEKGFAYAPPGKGTRSLWVFDELLTHKIPSHSTGGAYTLFEIATQPGAGPPPHIQHREDESFYILEGEYEFLIGGETLRVGAGSLLYIPKGTLHAHRGVAEDAGRMLVTQTPGGLYERFFEEVGKPADGEAAPPVFEVHSDAAGIRASAAEYGIEIPRPDAR